VEITGMTRYDMLIDSINIKLYEVFNMGRTLHDADWDEDTASEISHHILELVEEFKSL
tara:strand:+ start:370 stop:543 length:174 start_codon:yes stop_codon:yes gene_type:complete